MLGGIVLSFAGSPPVAERIGYDSFHFVKRHASSSCRQSLVLIATLVPLAAAGAARSADRAVGLARADDRDAVLRRRGQGRAALDRLAGFTLQPSEFMKPAFVVICAWLFAENATRTEIPGNLFALILLAIVVALLCRSPISARRC